MTGIRWAMVILSAVATLYYNLTTTCFLPGCYDNSDRGCLRQLMTDGKRLHVDRQDISPVAPAKVYFIYSLILSFLFLKFRVDY